MKVTSPSKVLLTGPEGFTGKFLQSYLDRSEFDIIPLRSNLLDLDELSREVQSISPSYVIHLGALSFAAELDVDRLYKVNVLGTTNLLDVLSKLATPPQKIVLSSSAAVYGNRTELYLNEDMIPSPVNHYGCSKLSMEFMAKNYSKKLNLLITRPFNYTGPLQDNKFLIPKIVNAYKSGSKLLELGNLDVSREFNDIRDVCSIYRALLTANTESGDVLNICSGRAISLLDIINFCDAYFDRNMDVIVNENFVRENEIKFLAGNPKKLDSIVGNKWSFSYKDTVEFIARN